MSGLWDEPTATDTTDGIAIHIVADAREGDVAVNRHRVATGAVDGSQIRALTQQINDGVPIAVARGITWCETGGERADALLAALPARTAHVIGLTGAPGVGKSTLLNAMVAQLRSRGHHVGVVAVDPSSPVTGGALLGDRVRLETGSGDPGVFFRSVASRGASGGLSPACRSAATILSAAGFDVVLIETVGAGQSEVDIMRVADSVVVVLIPGAGDEIQALKAGIMEIADVFVLNKADLTGMAELRASLVGLLHTREAAAWQVPLVPTVALLGEGVDNLLDTLEQHRTHLGGGGEGATRQGTAGGAELLRSVTARFNAAANAALPDVLADIASGALSEAEAGRRLTRLAARSLTGD